MGIYSKHLLIDLAGLRREICLDVTSWLAAFRMVSEKYGFRVVAENSHRFVFPDLPGITAFIMLDTSHFSIHTYADEHRAALDLFACTNQDLYAVWNSVRELLDIPDECVTYSNQLERFTNAK